MIKFINPGKTVNVHERSAPWSRQMIINFAAFVCMAAGTINPEHRMEMMVSAYH